MDVGEDKETIQVEPVKDPIREVPEPAPAVEPQPVPVPVTPSS